MSSVIRRCLLVIAALGVCTQAQAQDVMPGPPGPYVIDLRGVTIGIPNDPAFFPSLPAEASIPARGFGLDVGAHVYPVALGPARLGFGVDVTYARGTVSETDLASVVHGLAPQVSFNFGNREGWSYLSAGYGTVSVRSEAPVTAVSGASTGAIASTTATTGGVAESGSLGAINLGGGARWFLSRHVAVGFDLRFYVVGSGSETPSTKLFSAAAGLSLR